MSTALFLALVFLVLARGTTGEDRFTQWLEDECEVELGNDHKRTPMADLYASWATYCRENGDEPGSKWHTKIAAHDAGQIAHSPMPDAGSLLRLTRAP